jgi:hypothetical protein
MSTRRWGEPRELRASADDRGVLETSLRIDGDLVGSVDRFNQDNYGKK